MRELLTLGPRSTGLEHRSLTLIFFSILVYPLRIRGKDGHYAAAQIVSG